MIGLHVGKLPPLSEIYSIASPTSCCSNNSIHEPMNQATATEGIDGRCCPSEIAGGMVMGTRPQRQQQQQQEQCHQHLRALGGVVLLALALAAMVLTVSTKVGIDRTNGIGHNLRVDASNRSTAVDDLEKLRIAVSHSNEKDDDVRSGFVQQTPMQVAEGEGENEEQRHNEFMQNPAGQFLQELDQGLKALAFTPAGGSPDPAPPHGPRLAAVPNATRCNITAPIPQFPNGLRSWKIGGSWKLACERRKTKKARYPVKRNWCWVVVKDKCHASRKKHMSWTAIQERAAFQAFHPLEFPEVCDQPQFGVSRRWTTEEWEQSYRWAKENLKVYVLNLPQDVKRWEKISSRLEVLTIKATRVLGVDMRIPGTLLKAKKAGWIPMDFHSQKSHGLHPGTLGCALAHFKAQAQIIKENFPLAVVFEDDSWPADDFIPRLWHIVTTELPCDWEATALVSRCPYGRCISEHLMRVQPDGNEPAWRCHQGVNSGMHGVLYRTETLPELQIKWQAAVFNEQSPHCLNVDLALASISDRVGFYAVPAVQKPGLLVEHDMGSSRWNINVGSDKSN